MKKKIVSLVMAGLIGASSFSSLAANDNFTLQAVKPANVIGMISQQALKKGPGPKDKKDDKKAHDRSEKERKERERREKERKEKERREQERRERERKEQERRERERRERERREQERREQERRERLRREQQEDARYIIHRTADVIYVAQRSTSRRHYYKGMSKAIAHQQKAQRLYRAGAYQEAIFHSLRARRIAIEIIQGNREKWNGSWDTREDKYRKIAPRDADLDVRLDLIKIGDKEAVRISIDLDL